MGDDSKPNPASKWFLLMYLFSRTRAWDRTANSALGALLITAFLLLIPADLWAGNASADDPTVTEYEVKAAYIYYFAKFIEWSPEAFVSKSTPLTIGIIGDDEFGRLLGNIVKNKTIQDRPIAVRPVKTPADFRTCHMVFVSSSEQKRFRQIADSLQGTAILTITEAEEGSSVRGIMNLFVEGGKVQFEVDMSAAEKANLRISSKLLRLARGSTRAHLGKGE